LTNDGKRIYYMTSKDNPNYFNTVVRDLEKDTDKIINVGETTPTYLMAVSEAEAAFVYSQMFANTYITSFVQVGDARYDLTPDPSKVHVVLSPIFVDENTIYFITDYESDYHYLAKFSIDTQQFSKVYEMKEESIGYLEWHKESNTLYMVTEKGVIDQLYRFSLDTEKVEKLSMPIDIIEQLQVTKSGLLYVLGRSATVPFNIFQSNDGLEWKQLTDNRVLGITSDDMVEPEVVTYQSFDQMEIEALLYRAKPEHDNGYMIFWPHGGPQAAERKQFRAMFQCFLNRGYSIFAPNFRGSTGYGTTFVKLVERDWGDGPRRDCVAGIEWLIANNLTSKDKLFLIGGSFGGYMALLLHGRHPEYFKAVVDIFGPSNLFSFVNSVPDHWKPIMDRWIGDPERDKERFIKDSPDTYLNTMTKPMLVIQGANDPRVVKAESDQIVEKLREKKREVEYLVLEDEGHGFSKKENEIKVYQHMLSFLEKHQS
ncbi:MAG TPA: alpha/beta fold hydrolase, partial [Cerasibacillus sp.]|uniref:alpha/beta hydrolase family protein n=1 Tax=Cerasibacillus sp. TaxID=2498711 RepID=UPI002F416E99